MTRRRGLNAEEWDLWRKVTEKAERLHPDRQGPVVPAAPQEKPAPMRQAETRIESFALGAAAKGATGAHDLQPPLSERLSQAPVRMDRKAYGRMKRGKLKPEGRIDLHGMTLDRAHPALNRFILSAQASGKRLVLVITGKGRDRPQDGPIPVPRGILKHQVPIWLSSPPLAQAVLQVTEAHVSHGGGGAFYVYLKRPR